MKKRFLFCCAGGLLCSAAYAAGPNGLNDTGVDRFSNGTVFVPPPEPLTFPQQDPRIGRDPAVAAGVLVKTGAGNKGFDFTKIANDGSSLAVGAALGPAPGDWACTQDNTTGLTWEVKTDDGLLLDKDWSYTWFSSDAATNGGNPGTPDGGTCSGAGGVTCDTEKYTGLVNIFKGTGLCNHNDWRLPTVDELASIIDYSITTGTATVDSTFFPNTFSSVNSVAPGWYWAANVFAPDTTVAWGQNFQPVSSWNGYGSKLLAISVRLVRP